MNTREQKNKKEDKLLNTALDLFTKKGINNTSIQEIVDNANVAKGTFYLYFKDKYEIRDILILKKSEELFDEALKESRKEKIDDFTEKVIFVIDYVIDQLKNNPEQLKFISKNLSWGVYTELSRTYRNNLINEKSGEFYTLLTNEMNNSNINLKNSEVTLFMIIELVSSTCFDSILYNNPLPIEEYKPFLYDTIRKLLN